MKLYHIERKAFLQWMRACYDTVNTEVFNGELPPITINVENLKDAGADGMFRVMTRTPRAPITMHIVVGLHNAYFEDFDTLLYPIIIIAHEMIHVYCFLHNIKDCDHNGYHNNHFKEVAEKYGMYCRENRPDIGYSDVWLTDEQIARVFDRIPVEIWDTVINNIKFVNVRKSIQMSL